MKKYRVLMLTILLIFSLSSIINAHRALSDNEDKELTYLNERIAAMKSFINKYHDILDNYESYSPPEIHEELDNNIKYIREVFPENDTHRLNNYYIQQVNEAMAKIVDVTIQNSISIDKYANGKISRNQCNKELDNIIKNTHSLGNEYTYRMNLLNKYLDGTLD